MHGVHMSAGARCCSAAGLLLSPVAAAPALAVGAGRIHKKAIN